MSLVGKSQQFLVTTAVAKGTEVLLSCPEVSAPAFVRYAWKNNPAKANLRGTNGLPAVPFQATLPYKGYSF